MKPGFVLLALSLFALVNGAHAEPEFIRSSDGRYSILIMPKSECVSTLDEVFHDSIVTGLKALLEGTEERDRTLGCAANLSKYWTMHFATPSFELFDKDAAYRFRWDKEKRIKMDEAYKMAFCHNPHPLGSSAHQQYSVDYGSNCGNQWLSKDEAEDFKAEHERLSQEFRLAEQEWFRQRDLRMRLAKILTPATPDRSQLDALHVKKQCQNPYSLDDANHQLYAQQFAHACSGKWLSKKESAKVMAEFNAAATKFLDEEKAFDAKADRIRAMLADNNYELEGSVNEILAEYRCFNPYEPYSKDHSWYLILNEKACGGKWVDAARAAELEKNLRLRYRNMDEHLDAWQIRKDKSLAEQRHQLDQRNMPYYRAYNLRRLVALFQAHSRSNKELDIDGFCSEFEAIQRRDKRFAEGNLVLAPFQYDEDWIAAQKYGLSEGELLAIRSYTGNHYRVINKAIWNNNPTERDKLFQEVMDAGLYRLPIYSATPVIRETKLPQEVLAEHEVGAIVTYKAYTSTSRDQNWRWDGSHRFVIYGGKRGRSVEEVSGSPGEREVLFQAGTRFKVLSKKLRPNQNDVYEFVLVEVDEEDTSRPPLIVN